MDFRKAIIARSNLFLGKSCSLLLEYSCKRTQTDQTNIPNLTTEIKRFIYDKVREAILLKFWPGWVFRALFFSMRDRLNLGINIQLEVSQERLRLAFYACKHRKVFLVFQEMLPLVKYLRNGQIGRFHRLEDEQIIWKDKSSEGLTD